MDGRKHLGEILPMRFAGLEEFHWSCLAWPDAGDNGIRGYSTEWRFFSIFSIKLKANYLKGVLVPTCGSVLFTCYRYEMPRPYESYRYEFTPGLVPVQALQSQTESHTGIM